MEQTALRPFTRRDLTIHQFLGGVSTALLVVPLLNTWLAGQLAEGFIWFVVASFVINLVDQLVYGKRFGEFLKQHLK